MVTMEHGKHMWWMAGLLVAGALLYGTGAVGAGALVLLWPLACMAMMGAMMWAMRPGPERPPARHDDVEPRSPAERPR